MGMHRAFTPLDYHSIDQKLTEMLEYGSYEQERSEYYWNYEETICELKNIASYILDRVWGIMGELLNKLPYKNVTFYCEDDSFSSGIAWFNTCVALLDDLDMTMLFLNEEIIESYDELENEIQSLTKEIDAKDVAARKLGDWDSSEYAKLHNKIKELKTEREKVINKVAKNKDQRINAFRKLTKDQMILCYTLVTNFVVDYLQLEKMFDVVKANIDELEYNNSFMMKHGEGVDPKVAWVL